MRRGAGADGGAFLEVYSGRAGPRRLTSMLLGGELAVEGMRYRSVKAFASTFDYSRHAWCTFYLAKRRSDPLYACPKEYVPAVEHFARIAEASVQEMQRVGQQVAGLGTRGEEGEGEGEGVGECEERRGGTGEKRPTRLCQAGPTVEMRTKQGWVMLQRAQALTTATR